MVELGLIHYGHEYLSIGIQDGTLKRQIYNFSSTDENVFDSFDNVETVLNSCHHIDTFSTDVESVDNVESF